MPMGWKVRAAVHLLTAFISLAAGNTRSAHWVNEQPCEDPTCGSIGPDGPWRAIRVWVGDTRRREGRSWSVPMYPSGSSYTVVPMNGNSDRYNPSDSSTANRSTLNERGVNISSPWASVSSRWEFVSGHWYFDYSLPIRRGESSLNYNINTGILYADDDFLIQIGGKSWKAKSPIGALGLGRRDNPSGYIQQLKDENVISSASFSLNLGSVPKGPGGSFYYGGYEKNRVLGDVAVMNFSQGHPNVFLLDVILGVETGGSPFNRTGDNSTGDPSGKSWSVWSGVGDHQPTRSFTMQQGGPSGAMVTTVNPASPYIYLPSAVCSAVAEYLPVRWQEDIGYYVWNTEDDRFERLINSPAYMGFVFSDRERNEVTIKVPFPYLNLNLTTPIVSGDAVPYFPCMPFNIETGRRSELGRAFLQAAFFAVRYDNNIAFLAQGPGPDLEQSLVRRFADLEGDEIESDPIESFQKTWSKVWTVLDEDAFDPIPSSNSSLGGDDDTTRSGLSAGEIAGISVGSVAAMSLLVGVFFFLLKRRRAQSNDTGGAASDVLSGPSGGPASLDQAADSKEAYHTVTSNSAASQVTMAQRGRGETSPLHHSTEMNAPANAHMSLDGSFRFEMDSTQPPTTQRETYSTNSHRVSRVSV